MAPTRHARDSSSTDPTKADNEQFKREARARDRHHARADREGYRAGRRSGRHERHPDEGDAQFHEANEPGAGDTYRAAYERGRKERNETKPANSSSSSSSSRGPRKVITKLDMGDEFAGFVLSLLAWAIFVNYARDGTAGVTAWLRAKFFNEPPGYTPPNVPLQPKQAPGAPSNPNGIAPGTRLAGQPAPAPTTPSSPTTPFVPPGTVLV